eukprot:354817-Chlamydomonas_euryale.AAC.2
MVTTPTGRAERPRWTGTEREGEEEEEQREEMAGVANREERLRAEQQEERAVGWLAWLPAERAARPHLRARHMAAPPAH